MNSLRTAKRFWFPLLGLWVLLYASFSLFKPPLLDGTDSIQAEAAREMALHGDWITPHVNGVRYLAVSPLLTWTTAVSFKLFGVADWAARLPLALFALALFVTTLALGARLFLTPVAGFYAALTLLTSAGIFLFAHLLYPQVLVTLWLTLAIYYFWRSLHREHASLGTAVGFSVACALGVLTQGLSGVIVPVVIVVSFLAITRSLSHLLRWHPAIIVLVFLLIAVPWHIAQHRANAINTHLLTAPGPLSAPVLVVWAFLLLWIMPWCFFSVAALVRLPAPVAPHSKHMDPSHQVRLLLVLWLIVVALMVAFTHRREFSVLPALPALALLGAGWLAADEAAPSRTGRAFAWVFLALGVTGAGVALFFAVRAPYASSGVDIATLLHLHLGKHHLFLGHIGDLTFASMGAFRIPLYIMAASLLVGVVMNLYFRLKGHTRMANCFLAGMMACVLIAAHIALNTFSPVVSSAVLAEAINPEINSGDLIVVDGHYTDASALAFYLERQVILVNAPANDLGRFSSDNAALVETPATLATQWSGDGRVFLWTTPEKAPKLPTPVYLIGRDGGREILSNEPNSGGASF
ncbi:MAG TPA: glycosyltransferase family 39 protein [Acidobacteriaceae bacterium]|nr:glycosyltransferase family 39 protein [Acidobacteriaceae bacterium]